VSAKALKILGATEEEVRLEKAFIVSHPRSGKSDANRIFVECFADPSNDDGQGGKAVRVLGLPNEPPLSWLQQNQGERLSSRRLPSKALATLGATIDDVRIEKALLVLGEAPGREIPSGPLPRPRHTSPNEQRPVWAVAPPRTSGGLSFFLCAFLPWGVLGPLNLLKLQLNKVALTALPAHARSPAPRFRCPLILDGCCRPIHR
jgi:hypothetical protein